MPAATLWMSLSHLSQRLRFTGGFSVSGVVSGLPGAGRPEVSLPARGRIMAEVPTDLVATFSPTLASFIGVLAGAGVIVSLFFFSTLNVCVVLVDEDFLDTLGEFTDSLLDTLGDIDFRRQGDVRLDNLCLRSRGSSIGGSTAMSATLGDSVSLNAKSSVSVCFDARITSTHFSVQMPMERCLVGSPGSSMILPSPPPTLRISAILSTPVGPQAML